MHQVLEAATHKIEGVRPPAPITKTIPVRRTRHAGHCRRCKVKLVCDIPLWSP